MDRLEALDGRGIAITDDILGKIGVAAPNTNKRPDAPGTKRGKGNRVKGESREEGDGTYCNQDDNGE